MVDSLDIFLDDRAVIEIIGDVVGRRPDDLDPALISLAIGLGPFETRQKAMMDTDASPGQLRGELSGQNLHISG